MERKNRVWRRTPYRLIWYLAVLAGAFLLLQHFFLLAQSLQLTIAYVSGRRGFVAEKIIRVYLQGIAKGYHYVTFRDVYKRQVLKPITMLLPT